MIQDVLPEGLTFDDVLLEPARSEVRPGRSRYPHLPDAAASD